MAVRKLNFPFLNMAGTEMLVYPIYLLLYR